MGEYDRAEHRFRQAIDSGHPDWAPAAAFSLGVLLADRGDPHGAEEAYRQAIDSGHPDWAPAAAFSLGNVLAERGQMDSAAAAYRQAMNGAAPVETASAPPPEEPRPTGMFRSWRSRGDDTTS